MGNVILALIFVGLLFFILATFLRGMKAQREGRVGVVETWGRFARVVPPGRYLLWPWEQVVSELPLQVFEYETPPQQIATRTAPITLTMVLHYQLEHAHRTAGAPRPAQVLGSEPVPIGTPQLAPAYSSPSDTTVANSRFEDALGQVSRSGPGSRGAAGLSLRSGRNFSRTGALMLSRMFPRSGQLPVEQAAYRAVYTVPDWQAATEHESVATMQQIFSSVNVTDDVLKRINWQIELGEVVRRQLSQKTNRWGVEIIDVSFKDLKLPENAVAVMSNDVRLEREAQQRLRDAENYGNIARILGLSSAELLRWRQIEILRELAKNPNVRLMFSTDMAGQPLKVAAADPAPPPEQAQNYLGSEPPTPALPGPTSTATDSLLTPPAPILQRNDQQ